ncbi:MAG: hypothetical protein ABIV06_10510, partial [Thermoanaerobaculia bacterium]
MGNGYLAWSRTTAGLVASRDDAERLGEAGSAAGLSAPRLAEFFGFAELSGRETFFTDIHALLPGEMRIVQRGEVRHRSLLRPRFDLRIE